MNTDMSLAKIDTSHWHTKDPVWVEQRQAQWPAIEKIVGINRRKGDVTVIKDYFLRGKMPNWKKYKDWDDLFRHLDVDLCLWLHPSNDFEVLNNLYKTYMESDLIHPRDVTGGYGSFIDNEFLRAVISWDSLDEYPFPYRGEKNIIIFRVLFGDINYAKNRIRSLVSGQTNGDEIVSRLFEYQGYQHFLKMWQWLLQDPSLPLSKNNLYQYEDVLEWCLTTLTPNNENKFLELLKTPVSVILFQKALYCLSHFDTEKEGDTHRTYFIHNIRKILDERTFVPEFKQLWEDIKTGRIEVKDPWMRR